MILIFPYQEKYLMFMKFFVKVMIALPYYDKVLMKDSLKSANITVSKYETINFLIFFLY